MTKEEMTIKARELSIAALRKIVVDEDWSSLGLVFNTLKPDERAAMDLGLQIYRSIAVSHLRDKFASEIERHVREAIKRQSVDA